MRAKSVPAVISQPHDTRVVHADEPRLLDCVAEDGRAQAARQDERIVVPGTHHHIDPGVWSPLIYNFRHYHGLTPELGHGFRSETVKAATRVG